jgi:PTH1 family peptidyl-tRNA hydrolase
MRKDTPATQEAVRPALWLIAGLGNPGPRYVFTRHNLGFLVVSALAEQAGIALDRHSLEAQWGRGRLADTAVILAQPTTYMNLSGRAVAKLLQFFKLPPGALVVIHDDLDVPPGRLKLARGGGAGGHKGVLSILEALGTPDFYRVKLGIGRPPGPWAAEDFVLAPFDPAAEEALAELVDRGAQAVVTLITHGLAAAQNRFHGLTPSPPHQGEPASPL